MPPSSTLPAPSTPRAVRWLRGLLVAGAGAAIAAVTWVAPAAGQAPLDPVASLAVPGTPLVIDRPAAWQEGGVVGYGVLVSLIGRGEGYPNFSVMTDPELQPDPGATNADVERDIEALYDELIAAQGNARALEASWIRVNGLRVHSSLTTWRSVTGHLRARRLIVAIGGKPFLFTWTERDERFAEIAELVERCAGSLRLAARSAVGGGA